MTVQTPVDALAGLLDYLDGLESQAPVETLADRLRSLEITAEDVADYAHFNENRYVRNLVRSSPWYHLLVICWRSGQRSPIHDHAQSTCGFRILKGVATETKFELTPASVVKAVNSQDFQTGDVVATRGVDIHQVSNLQAEGEDLITLHIYSPPLLKMSTFSLIDRTVGEFRPVILEHDHGSGI